VIVEDGAFVGSRAIVVEGVRVEQARAVLGANVVLTAQHDDRRRDRIRAGGRSSRAGAGASRS
jgi:tetrahydrodipicolinate N-succinyltransferase